MSDFDSLNNPDNSGDSDDLAFDGERGLVYRISVAEVESARECLDAEDECPTEEAFECRLVVDGVVHAALRRFLDSICVAACRYPVHLLGLEEAMVGALVAAGVPGAALHATVAEYTSEYYDRLDRAADAWLPAPLLRVYKYLRPDVGARPVRVYRDGTVWGYSGPVLVLGRLPYQDEYYLSLDPLDPDVLVLGKDPIWPGEYPDLRLDLRAEGVLERIGVLTRSPCEWSEEPSTAGAEWEERWDVWAAQSDPDEGWDPDAMGPTPRPTG